MTAKFLSADSIWKENVLAIIRMIVGLFLIYHGAEVFDKVKMQEYGKWIPDMSSGSSLFISYLGKSFELVAGILLFTGFLTRVASIIVLITFAMITFRIGEGRIFMEEQYPFMFCIFGALFLFAGAGKWSVDSALFKRK